MTPRKTKTGRLVSGNKSKSQGGWGYFETNTRKRGRGARVLETKKTPKKLPSRGKGGGLN